MADGDPVIIGVANTGASATSLTANVEDNALFVENTGIGTNSAIYAKYVNPLAGGAAITAEANYIGVTGFVSHDSGVGIIGTAAATSGTATGVQGFTEVSSNYNPTPRLCGVQGFADAGIGVRGDSVTGYGIAAASQRGIALGVEGRSAFATAGNGVMPAGTSRIAVAQVNVTSQSHITVTLTGNPGNEASVHWVERTAAVGFEIHLSNHLARETPFSYLIVEPI
jgi:hypothetical protein